MFGVSQATASRIINKIKKEYDIDEKRLPVPCCVPASILHDYYDFSDKLKKRKENEKNEKDNFRSSRD